MTEAKTEAVAKPIEVHPEEGAIDVARSPALVQTEVQGALVVAKRFPRDEEAAFSKIMKAVNRPSFAERAAYSYPRGGTTIEGPAVYLAREIAKCYGNMRFGLRVTRDTDDERDIEAFAWDVENNVWVTMADSFAKKIQRRNRNTGKTEWVEPDERDLRELTFRRGAILVRNAILQVVPADLVSEALTEAKATLARDAAKDPDALKKSLLTGFARAGVGAEDLRGYLGHAIDKASAEELARLRTLLRSVLDGETTWAEHAPDEAPATKTAPVVQQPGEKTADALVRTLKRAAPQPKPPREARGSESQEGSDEEDQAEADPSAPEATPEPTPEPADPWEVALGGANKATLAALVKSLRIPVPEDFNWDQTVAELREQVIAAYRSFRPTPPPEHDDEDGELDEEMMPADLAAIRAVRGRISEFCRQNGLSSSTLVAKIEHRFGQDPSISAACASAGVSASLDNIPAQVWDLALEIIEHEIGAP